MGNTVTKLSSLNTEIRPLHTVEEVEEQIHQLTASVIELEDRIRTLGRRLGYDISRRIAS